MIQFLQNNLGTIIVLAVLAVIVVLIVIKLVRDRRNGVSSCGGSCSGCAMRGECHKNQK